MSKVTTVDAAAYTVPLPQPEADGTFAWDATTVVIARVHAAGEVGIGFTYGAVAGVDVITGVLAPRVVGRDAFDIPRAWRAMADALRNRGRPGVASTALAAVDAALWDLKAKLFGVPLVRLLGAARDGIEVYGSGGFVNLDDDVFADQLTGWLKDGITKVKMKIGVGAGADVDEDVRRVRFARSVVGDGVELFVDANGAYDRKQAARQCRAFEDLGVTWFEEPVTSDDLESLGVLRDLTAIDITAGEYGYLLQYFAEMLRAVDVIQPDASRCSLSEWLRVAALAAANSREVSAHCAPSLHAHPACAALNTRHIEYFADHTYVDPLLFDGVLTPVDGRLWPALDRPGFGLELRGDAEQYRVK